ncbi:hypothetical protein SNE25_09785 [Mucilaginibacter sabulilitoris]|uniref:Uncharacterized protein n=1 Tax=Mucilaginibacter sabulilitoris TaxID=1173583 RepID=A0ABZ0TRR2_9SPHI|nr:hypothetical protein [Mucilaginibacter sabulilitoris]WPU95807.1 hypothetical protein SNE25_09785 [Mucilaginibacter sabulilitoris]
MKKSLLSLVFLILFLSCKQHVQSEIDIYNNDFETNDLTNIKGGLIDQFNSSKVLGRYNNGDFILSLNNLPQHDLIIVSFDLYIHDNWRGELLPDGPAIWQMRIDGGPYINTTFSNLACPVGNICPPQSYPDNYPNNNHNPRSGAYRTDLPGVCSMKSESNGTTMYKITKTFKHSGKTLSLECLDKLDQKDYPDPKCEKSWSVDNIDIKAITL